MCSLKYMYVKKKKKKDIGLSRTKEIVFYLHPFSDCPQTRQT